MAGHGVRVLTIETPSLGDRSYLVTDGTAAVVIDPQRDIDRILALVEQHQLRVTHVLETHIHNDYVTGGLELARRTGAGYFVEAQEDVRFDRAVVGDGDELKVGSFVMRVMSTPGHTRHHLSYVAYEDGRAVAVFTGGSMLYGTVGRTDLISDDATEQLTRAQFRSVRALADGLDDGVAVYPTHGFGSFCSSAASSGSDRSTIGEERKANMALTVDEEDVFVEQLLAGLTAYPSYYAHMGLANREGPGPIDLSPAQAVDKAELRRRINDGQWVVDLRSRRAYAASHVVGTVNVEYDQKFVTYLAWTMPWGTPVTLIADTAEDVAAAQRDLVRVNVDRPAGAATGGIARWGDAGPRGSYQVASFADLATAVAQGDVVVLDVRRDDEWAAGHVRGAIHVPLHALSERLAEVPSGEVWVHCGSGYRAAIATSLLEHADRTPILIDEDWENAATTAGLTVVEAA